MKQYTDITVLLDRSGSMETIRTAMEEAFNAFVEAHRAVESTRLTLVQFDTTNNHEVVYEDTPIRSVEKLHLVPRGGTPLVDAFVKLIDSTGARLRSKRESERPDQVLFVVITDGDENSSQKYKRTDVSSRVANQTNNYNWQFIYLGANQDAIKEASSYGIPWQQAINFAANAAGTTGSASALAANTLSYAINSGNERGLTKSITFTEEQRKKAMDE